MTFDIRQVRSPAETRSFDTQQQRSAYLIEALFAAISGPPQLYHLMGEPQETRL